MIWTDRRFSRGKIYPVENLRTMWHASELTALHTIGDWRLAEVGLMQNRQMGE